MIKNIVFDMGNVLLDFNPQFSLDRWCHSEEEKELIRRELFLAPEWLMADRGVIRDCDRYDRIKDRVPEENRPALKACADHWADCMVPLPGAKEFVADCKAAGYKVYILSNASDLFFTYFNNFSSLDWFDGAVISCQELLLKPEAELYQRLFDRYDLKPEECFFIDDREDNIRGGEALGMSGHVFHNDYPTIREKLGLRK
jgi:putative hydrolase of the HAD superfamily